MILGYFFYWNQEYGVTIVFIWTPIFFSFDLFSTHIVQKQVSHLLFLDVSVTHSNQHWSPLLHCVRLVEFFLIILGLLLSEL